MSALDRPNSFKAVLVAKRRQIGSWLAMSDPYLAEVSATVGFDWLLINSGHVPNDVRTIFAQLQAVALYRAEPIVWPYSSDPALIKRLLDIGARMLLMSMVDTVEQAHDLVCVVCCPPFDIRGVGSAVGCVSRWNARADYLQVADNKACLLVQAEAVIALQNLEAACAMNGADGAFIDPADPAASMDHHGNADHPEVQTVTDNAIRTIIASGKAAGTPTSDPVLACHYLELGCALVAIGIDILLFANGAHKLARDFIAPQTA